MKYLLSTATAACLLAGAAQASVLQFNSTLDSGQSTTSSTSTATGTASIAIDDSDETIDFNLSVMGLSLADLFDDLVANPVGPIHFHDGVSGTTGPIAIPFAFDGATYSDTATGFEVNVSDFAYADAVALSGFGESFDDFVAGMQNAEYYINVHSDANPNGDIRGQIVAADVAPVPLPASALLLLAGMGGLAALRRRKG